VQQHSAIAALTSASCVEDGAIERDSPRVGGQDGRMRIRAIGVVPEERSRHFRKTSGARPAPSSQSGTGRPFDRKKTGLNSLDAYRAPESQSSVTTVWPGPSSRAR